MTLQRLTPMLRTWDIPGTISFYTEIIGFTCTAQSEGQQWAELQCEGVTLMISGPNEHEGDTKPGFTGSLYITCDNVDEVWNRVRAHAKVCYGIETFDYGMREFGIYDNNGYLLQFGTPLV